MLKSELETQYGHLDLERLLCAIVETRDVKRRYQFFLWTQGHLQALLPHHVLICGIPRESGPGMAFDCFYNQPLTADVLARLCHPHEGVGAMLADLWRQSGCNPLGVSRDDSIDLDLRHALRACGLDHTLTHGVVSNASHRAAQCFFAFLDMPSAPTRIERDYARFVVPSAFDAYFQALSGDTPVAAPVRAAVEGEITAREIEILEWVRDGKSNQEIALILNISPLTVKNHVQNILRKLQSNNRAQAVSRAISLRLLRAVRARPGNEAESIA